MKPCRQFRKSIFLMATERLAGREADLTRQHLKSCENCRAYWQLLQQAASLPVEDALPLSTSRLHQKLMNRIRRHEAHKLESSFAFQAAAWLKQFRWERAFPVAAMVAVVILLAARLGRDATPGTPTSTTPAVPIPTVAARPSESAPPSLNHYRNALKQSLDALDDLLTHEGRTNPRFIGTVPSLRDRGFDVASLGADQPHGKR